MKTKRVSVLVVLVLLLVPLFPIVLPSQVTAASTTEAAETETAGQVIQQVSANGQRNLRPFTVKDKWEIQWDSKSTMLSITIFEADGKLSDTGPMQQGPGSGSSYQPKGGNYYLQVSGTGEWTVTVVQLP